VKIVIETNTAGFRFHNNKPN